MEERPLILSDAQRLALLAPRGGRLRAVLDTDTYNAALNTLRSRVPVLTPT